jgi:hypothetical protein
VPDPAATGLYWDVQPDGNSLRSIASISSSVGQCSSESPVTRGVTSLCGGAVGTWGAGGPGNLSALALGVACEACPLAGFSFTRTTLELGHLCFLAVLRELNVELASTRHTLPHVGGEVCASLSLSHLAARLRFCARRFFSFWALLALRPPFWRCKSTRRCELHSSSTGPDRGNTTCDSCWVGAHVTRIIETGIFCF